MTNTLKLIGLVLILLAVLLVVASIPGPSPEIFAEEPSEEAERIAAELKAIDIKIKRDLNKLTTEELKSLITRQTELEKLIVKEQGLITRVQGATQEQRLIIEKLYKEAGELVDYYHANRPFSKEESDRQIDAILAKQKEIDEILSKLSLSPPTPVAAPISSITIPISPVVAVKPKLTEPQILPKLEKPEKPAPDKVSMFFFDFRENIAGNTPSKFWLRKISDLIKKFPEFSRYIIFVDMESNTDDIKRYKRQNIKAPAISELVMEGKHKGTYRIIPLTDANIRKIIKEAETAHKKFLQENQKYNKEIREYFEYIESLPPRPTPLPVEGTIQRSLPIDPFK